MGSPPDQDGTPELADRVESALRALWQGDSTQMDQLVGLDDSPAPCLGEMLADLASPVTPVTGPPLPADAVPGYRIMREIGRGGMGVVYEALQEGTHREVALKVMLAGPFASPAAQARFRREVELTARLQHPGIVRVLEGGHLASGLPYYSMDYVRGVTLDRHLAATSQETAEIVALFIELCRAVHYAHQHGVIHRDLKPGNVLVDEEGQPHIVDFGLAKVVDTASLETLIASVSSPDQVVGTLRYLSPEQAAGQREAADGRTDVYTLGVMLFEALTGAMPYRTSGHPSEILRAILADPPVPPSSLTRRVDRDLDTIILKALEKDPDRRYPSVGELGEDLRRWLDGELILARPPSLLYVLRRWLTRHRRKVVLAGAGLGLAVMVLGVGLWWRQRALDAARAKAIEIRYALDCHEVSGARQKAAVLRAEWPGLPEAHLLFYHAAFASPDPRDRTYAISELKSELQQNPGRWYCAALLAEMYRQKNQTDELEHAGELEVQVEEQMPETAEAWYVRSFATMDREKGLDWARRAASGASGQLAQLAWQRVAWSLLLADDPDDWKKALRAAETLLHLGADRRDWTRFRAGVLVRLDRVQEAIAQYDSLLARNPSDHVVYVERAHAWRRLGKYENAVKDYGAATRLIHPAEGSVWVRYQRATPLWILGRTREAEKDYRSVRPHLGSPSYADARLYIILRDEGRESEANELLNTVLEDSEGKETGPDRWRREICKCLSGKTTPEKLIGDALSGNNREHRCEAYYYAGETYRLGRNFGQASECFRQCVDTQVAFDIEAFPQPMNEYELADWRLRELTGADHATSRP